MKYAKINIFEPDLKKQNGHYLETALHVKNYLGMQVTIDIFGNKSIEPELAKQYGITPFFNNIRTDTFYDRFSHTRYIWRLHKLIAHFGIKRKQDLFDRNLREYLPGDGGELMFFPSLYVYEMLGVIEYMEKCEKTNMDAAIILRYMFPQRDVRRLNKFLLASPVRRRIHLYSDSEMLIDEYRRAGLKGVCLLPIPHLPELGKATNDGIGKKLKIVYVGGVRFDKGFQFLPGIVRYLQSVPELQEYEIIAQAHMEDIASDCERIELTKYIDELKNFGVKLYRNTFISEEYCRFLNDADIILLPYDNNVQQKRYYCTSGILAEAIALGKVVVVPSETWLSQQIANSKSGVIFDSPEQLPEKVKQCILNYPTLKKNAMAYITEWRKIHSIEKYCEILLNSNNSEG